MSLRWEPCVNLLGEECEDFLANYLDSGGRKCLVIGGAGFDPRTTLIAKRLGSFTKAKVKGIYFREERRLPQPKLHARAEAHQKLVAQVLDAQFLRINIFAEGVTPIGGREAAKVINQVKLDDYSDLIVDISAMSAGVAFPVIRILFEKCRAFARAGTQINLHLLTVEEPTFDHKIRGIPGETATYMHGFRGAESLDTGAQKALLWLPTLAPGVKPVLQKIHNFLSKHPTPIDVCPIVPFPGHDPRLPDRLVDEFKEELVRWRADFRNLLYSAESDPLDAYRTICSIQAAREGIFSRLGGSVVVLSPVGNKLLAVGAMLAAIEKNLPIAMVESVGYDETAADLQIVGECDSGINHIWLFGEAYARSGIGST